MHGGNALGGGQGRSLFFHLLLALQTAFGNMRGIFKIKRILICIARPCKIKIDAGGAKNGMRIQRRVAPAIARPCARRRDTMPSGDGVQ